MKLVTVGEMRAIEKQADSRGVKYEQMMENAGLSLASVVMRLMAKLAPNGSPGWLDRVITVGIPW